MQPKYLINIYIKTTGRDAPKAIDAAEAQFKQYNGQYPFSYLFWMIYFNNLYKGEQTEGKLFNYFAAIAIFISCLGLLGLAAYTAQVRTREIGVRKVLGASISRIVRLAGEGFYKTGAHSHRNCHADCLVCHEQMAAGICLSDQH